MHLIILAQSFPKRKEWNDVQREIVVRRNISWTIMNFSWALNDVEANLAKRIMVAPIRFQRSMPIPAGSKERQNKHHNWIWGSKVWEETIPKRGDKDGRVMNRGNISSPFHFDPPC